MHKTLVFILFDRGRWRGGGKGGIEQLFAGHNDTMRSKLVASRWLYCGMRATRTVVSDQSDQRDNRQPALYWPGPQSTTPLMLMPATSPWFPRDPTSFVSPYAVEPWLRYVSPVLLVAE
ncbi:hypothetical protein GGI35DRAFT_205967 [Trichoderma velutinum]